MQVGSRAPKKNKVVIFPYRKTALTGFILDEKQRTKWKAVLISLMCCSSFA